nr:hypothetical protein [Tanacetum cinerariifolium]
GLWDPHLDQKNSAYDSLGSFRLFFQQYVFSSGNIVVELCELRALCALNINKHLYCFSEEEDEENEDADMEEDDDAEIIFPYEVQGDQTLPPRDESSYFDSEPEAEEADNEPEAEEADDELKVKEAGAEPEAEGADVEFEAEEPDGVPEATIGTGSQRPFAVRDFPMGFYETGESFTARDLQFVGGLAPWALRRDIEALRRHERIREAESETSRTEVALRSEDGYRGRGTEEDPIEEPEPLAGHGDQFDAHPNPQPGNMNSWVDDDDDVKEEEDDENEDADIEKDDDAEIIFPYEVQGDQTPPPRDESSDSDSEPEAEEDDDEPKAEEADDELEVEEAGVEPEAEGADVKLEVEEPDGESSTARDPQFIGGLAPWVLRRDLKSLHRQERIREAESDTSRTEIALLGSEAKIRKMEREILHHDLSGVEETLRKVMERLKVLEIVENATLKKKSAEKEVLLDLTRMERDRAEKRLSESIWWNERFYLKMVRKGAVPRPPSDDEGSERPRKMPKKSDKDEGPSDPRGPLMIIPPKPMSEVRMREIIRDQFATSMNEFMANMNNGDGGSGGASGSGGAGGSGGTSGNADGTGVRGAEPTVPELTGCTYATFINCDPLPFNGTEGALGLCQWFEKLESVFQISECKEKDRVKFAMATFCGRALTWWNGRTKAMGIEAANSTPWSKVRKWMTKEFCPQSVIQRMEKELMVEPEAVKVEQYLRGLTKSIHGDVTSSQPATINDAVSLAYQLAGQLIQDKANEATEGEKKKVKVIGEVVVIINVSTTVVRTRGEEKGHRKRDCPKLGRNGQGGNNRGGVYQLGAVNAQEDQKVVT